MLRALSPVLLGTAFVLAGAGALPAAAAADSSLAVTVPDKALANEMGGTELLVKLDNRGEQDLSRVTLKVRLGGALSGRVELAAADWCTKEKTSATCSVDRITPGSGITARISLRARKDAPLGAAGNVTVTAHAATGTAPTATVPIEVTSPPYTDISASAASAPTYLRVGETGAFTVTYRNSGPVPGVLRIGKPGGTGFTDPAWTDCPLEDGDGCLIEALAPGATRKVTFTEKLSSAHPGEPHVAMTVDGAYDRLVTDNYASFPVCVHETGDCTRHVPGHHPSASPSAAHHPSAKPSPVDAPAGDTTAAQRDPLLPAEPEQVAVAPAHASYDEAEEVLGIGVYAVIGLLILAASGMLAWHHRHHRRRRHR
ncbi:hypothetical protein QEZ54_25255 [Catellatospora sp. KI3]|uniref:hypothetical protein n=1 Tax=Catellatospora sp. KI3 TaxID=3041620 RepID=UPI002482DB69|nr:hypothetical protein [Catellatospora sp. KI3]MDI1464283.1 hypothetical protein [Catellatospora sp. KI3]